MRPRSPCRALLLAGLVGCAATPPAPAARDPNAVRRELEALDANAMRLIDAGRGDSLATAYFTPDAVAAPPNGPAMRGADAIRAGFGRVPGGPRMALHWTIASVRVADSLASTQGTYTLNVYPPGPGDTTAAVVSDRGNYVTVFVRTAAGWRAVYDLADSEIPRPTAAPARK